ncbi:AMP-binding protein, partial [Corallococcus exiguus]|uniref:AMP-binding protein n=1 Tax=Corallococcus exiguus TaxID=83462 RepID=UPI002015E7BE
MPRGSDLLIAQIAITKSGAAWLPFDTEAPIDRVAACLSDAEAKGLLVPDDWNDRAIPTGIPVLTPSTAAAEGIGLHVDARQQGLTPDHPAYLIYTSGSTGKPKGIVVSHRNICHYLRSSNELYGIHAEDIVLQGCSAAFDLSMEE